MSDEKFETRLVPVFSIGIDRSYIQRPVRARIRALARAWDRSLAGALIVNQRPDGSYWLLDGQHRLEAAREVAVLKVLCHVYHLSPEDEASVAGQRARQGMTARPSDVARAREVLGMTQPAVSVEPDA